MVGAEADVPRLVLALVVVAERIAAGLGGRLVEPAPRKDAPRRLDPHRRGAPALVWHHHDLEAGVAQMILVALAGDAVRVDAVVRQDADRALIALAPQLVDVVR